MGSSRRFAMSVLTGMVALGVVFAPGAHADDKHAPYRCSTGVYVWDPNKCPSTRNPFDVVGADDGTGNFFLDKIKRWYHGAF